MYAFTSPHHPTVKRFVKLRTDKRFRRAEGRLVVIGSDLINELGPNTVYHTLLTSSKSQYLHYERFKQVFLVPEPILSKASGLPTIHEPIAEVSMPSPQPLTGVPSLLVLDHLQDPGNVGTLLRTALAFGWGGVFLIDCADPFNDKTLRASKGAIFSLPFREGSFTELQELVRGSDYHPLVADIRGIPFEERRFLPHPLLVLSNEARGPSPEALGLGEQITVPMQGEMESLNVAIAGGILMYGLATKGD